MDLGFGACKLQVQVPERGQYSKPSDLIGKNIGTSFAHLAEEYFATLEAEADAANGTKTKKLKTKIIELSGSVEAACALGVADGIVDLVGEYNFLSWNNLFLTIGRIRRNNEGSGAKTYRYRCLEYCCSHQIQEPHKLSYG
jgi:ATP phosphoribosyltransferase